jgi:hypothetical protein
MHGNFAKCKNIDFSEVERKKKEVGFALKAYLFFFSLHNELHNPALESLSSFSSNDSHIITTP